MSDERKRVDVDVDARVKADIAADIPEQTVPNDPPAENAAQRRARILAAWRGYNPAHMARSAVDAALWCMAVFGEVSIHNYRVRVYTDVGGTHTLWYVAENLSVPRAPIPARRGETIRYRSLDELLDVLRAYDVDTRAGWYIG